MAEDMVFSILYLQSHVYLLEVTETHGMSKGKEKRREEVSEREEGWVKGPRGLRSHLLLKLQVEFSPTTDTGQNLPTCTIASDSHVPHHFSVSHL